MTNTSISLKVIAKIGSKPRKIRAVVVAVADAKINGKTDAEVISSIKISSTKTTPVIGALKIAATAAPAPQHKSSVNSL